MENINLNCDCKKWKENIVFVNSCVMNSTIHNNPYTGEMFGFCPWCGKELVNRKDDE